MRPSTKYPINISHKSTATQLVKWILFLVTVTSLLVSSTISACAHNTINDVEGSTNLVYLPIISLLTPVYYVSPLGNDSNPGSITLPWRTIQKAAKTAEPGSTVYIHGGTYQEKITINQKGFQHRTLKFLAYPGEIPVIDGKNQMPGNGSALITIYGDWVEIYGLEVINSNYYGIGLYGKHNTVTNVYVHHNQKTGIYINGDYGIVQNSRVWRNSLINEYGASSSWSSGIAASRDTDDGITDYPIIRKNIVWENWGQGINTYEANHVTIENNISHDNFTNNIYIHDETNVLCQGNFIYMNPSSYVYGYGANTGIMMGDERDISSSNITIINNISFNNNYNYALFKGTNIITNILIANNIFVNGINDGGVLLRGNHQNIIFENNIVQQDGDLPLITIVLNPDVTFLNNLWSKTPPPEAAGPGDKIGNPMLENKGDYYSPDWFKLSSSSPAIDAAIPLPQVIIDFFGNARRGTPDIGATEFINPSP